MVSFNEYMSEKKEISRWMVLVIGLTGMTAGVVLATVYYIGLTVI